MVTTHICPYLRVQDAHSKEQPIGEQQEEREQPQQGAEHCYPGQGGSPRTRKQCPASQQQNEKLERQRKKQALTSSTTSLQALRPHQLGQHQEGQGGYQNQQAQDEGEGQRKEAYTVQFLYWTFCLLPEASQILLRQAVV